MIEAAYFNPGNIRSTSRKYSISTDSSYRFARDVDPQGTLEAARRAADLIAETAGGEIVETACLVGSAPRAARDIEISRKF
ncbi:phenylalanine--tRNA ligase beta subunit-related protein, partial [Escherichia coli]|nr:phenylalanine--tRNA ligase beta subunit-related protein [Escherichia coli]